MYGVEFGRETTATPFPCIKINNCKFIEKNVGIWGKAPKSRTVFILLKVIFDGRRQFLVGKTSIASSPPPPGGSATGFVF